MWRTLQINRFLLHKWLKKLKFFKLKMTHFTLDLFSCLKNLQKSIQLNLDTVEFRFWMSKGKNFFFINIWLREIKLNSKKTKQLSKKQKQKTAQKMTCWYHSISFKYGHFWLRHKTKMPANKILTLKHSCSEWNHNSQYRLHMLRSTPRLYNPTSRLE